MADEETTFLGSVQQEVAALIQGRQLGDVRLYEAISLLNGQLEKIARELSPLARRSLEIETGVSSLHAPINFICFATKITVRFTWDEVQYAGQYEVREGLDWDTASFRFRSSGLQGDIDPLLYGSYFFLIKTIDAGGNYSGDFAYTNIEIPIIAAPAITVSVIDNNVLLYWTEPASLFKIDYYIVEKTGDAAAKGRVDGTFTSIFEIVGGTYQYRVTAVDIAGNVGNSSEVEAFVNAPPDFALQDSRVSGLNGTRVNVIRLSPRPSLICCWQDHTWQEHFVTRSWLDIEDQMQAGYPIYIQPTAINGSYEEVVDYGVIITNTIITLSWNTIFHTPEFNVDVIVKMAVSDDGVTYTPFVSGASQYYRTLRFLKFRLEFTAENDATFIEIYNLTISLNVKRENDGGEIFANSADASGTQVNFTKPFKDVESITCTTKSPVEPYLVIFDFADVPNPVGFKVFVFDTMGARVSRTIDWKARGIV